MTSNYLYGTIIFINIHDEIAHHLAGAIFHETRRNDHDNITLQAFSTYILFLDDSPTGTIPQHLFGLFFHCLCCWLNSLACYFLLQPFHFSGLKFTKILSFHVYSTQRAPKIILFLILLLFSFEFLRLFTS